MADWNRAKANTSEVSSLRVDLNLSEVDDNGVAAKLTVRVTNAQAGYRQGDRYNTGGYALCSEEWDAINQLEGAIQNLAGGVLRLGVAHEGLARSTDEGYRRELWKDWENGIRADH